jgi:hypothetical protein
MPILLTAGTYRGENEKTTHNVPVGGLSGRRDGCARDPGRPAAHSREAGPRQANSSAAAFDNRGDSLMIPGLCQEKTRSGAGSFFPATK